MKQVRLNETVDINFSNGMAITIDSLYFAKRASKRIGISIDDALGDEKLLVEEFFIKLEERQ